MLHPQTGDVIWDMTIGAAGHAEQLLKMATPGGFLLGFDRDPQIAKIAVQNLESAGFERGRDFEIINERFGNTERLPTLERAAHPDVLLADLGVSSLQFDQSTRGFSFRHNGPLNMMMDPTEENTTNAAQIIATASIEELESIFRTYGEERWARRIACVIVERREKEPITTTHELHDVVSAAVPRKAWPLHINVATKVFQALRIAVNNELGELDSLLNHLPAILTKVGSRAGIISFHSLEDRRVKQAFRTMSTGCTCPPDFPKCVCGKTAKFQLLSTGGMIATEEETGANPRARSARLRGVKRIEEDKPQDK